MALRSFRGSFLLWILSAGCLPAALSRPCRAQTGFDATRLAQPAELDGGWLVFAGDEPSYAQPDFDDTRWLPFDAAKDNLHDLFPHRRPEVVWYRLHLKVDPVSAGLALDENNLSSAFEIYSNGIRLMRVGSVAPFAAATFSAHILKRIPEDQIASGSVILALRVHISASDWTDLNPGLYSSNLLFGNESVLREHVWLTMVGRNGLWWLNEAAFFGLSVGALLLYSAQRKQKEYLWLSFWAFSLFSHVLVSSIVFGFFSVPAYWNLEYSVFTLFFWYIATHMYCAFVQRPVGWRLNLYLLLVGSVWSFETTRQWLGSGSTILGLVVDTLIGTLTVAIIPAILISRLRRGNRDAGILLLPHLLFCANLVIGMIEQFLLLLPRLRPGAGALGRVTRWSAGPFVIDLFGACWLLSAFSMALIILLRSNRVSREHGLLDAEIGQAREVQQVILPEDGEAVPGFRIESVYLPVQQVGGDFFQILPDDQGGLLVVIGDVAGKGLPAAMRVSVLVGAVRTAAAYTRSPGEILAQLNERLMGRTHGGFSTALVAQIARNGALSIANAGHLSPCLDGKEIDLPGALPLGIAGGMHYELREFTFAPNSRLTFFSDGVIEARNQHGELFGFERARELASRPAAAIAAAAKDFGQSDDITVVVIERAGEASPEAVGIWGDNAHGATEIVPASLRPETAGGIPGYTV